MSKLVALALVALVAAGAIAGDRGRLRKPKRGHGFQTKMGTYTVGASEDLEVCEYRRLANTRPMDVSRFKLSMPLGAHHFALWTYGGDVQDDSRFPQGPVPSVGCVGIAPDEPFPQLLIPTTRPDTSFHLPKGVVLRLDANEQVFLNAHMRNATDAPVVPDVRFNLYRAKKGTVKHVAEGLTFGNSTDISIPAGGDQTLTVEWTSPIDLTIVYLATHQHRLGTHATIEMLSPDGLTKDLLVETDDWRHPGTAWPQGGLRIAKGQKMRITCSWHNTDDHTVTFGPETTDEMCFAIGFYYRDAGDTTPVVGRLHPVEEGACSAAAPAFVE
jgi:hypothetical protein